MRRESPLCGRRMELAPCGGWPAPFVSAQGFQKRRPGEAGEGGNFPAGRGALEKPPGGGLVKAGLLPAPAAPPANLLKIPRKSSAAPPAKSTLPQKLNPPSTTIPRPRYFTASKNVLSTIFLLTDIGFLAIFKKFKEQTVAKNT